MTPPPENQSEARGDAAMFAASLRQALIVAAIGLLFLFPALIGLDPRDTVDKLAISDGVKAITDLAGTMTLAVMIFYVPIAVTVALRLVRFRHGWRGGLKILVRH